MAGERIEERAQRRHGATARAIERLDSRFARLTSFSLMYLRLETPDWPCHFGGLAVLDGTELLDDAGQLRMPQIVERLEGRFARVPALRRRVYDPGILGGRPVWVDDHQFNLTQHLHVAAVPDPGGDAEFLESASRAYERLLDRHRPLWELWFLTGLTDGRVGVLMKLHHAMADGMAAVAIMASLFDSDPNAKEPAVEPWIPGPTPSRRALRIDNLATKSEAAKAALAMLLHPRRLLAGTRPLALVVRRSFGKYGLPPSPLNRPVRAGRRVGVVQLERTAAKTVARAHRGTTNDVVLDLWAGGLRRLLLSRNEPVDGVELTVGQAVSLRPFATAETIENQVGTVVLPLPIGEPDPRSRLDRIVATTRRTRGQRQRPAAIAGAMADLATTPLGRYFFNHQRATNVLVTNVVGPRAPVYLLGSRVREVVPIVQLLGNIGLTLCAFTYAGRISLVVTADRRAFPDLDVIVRGIEQDWLALGQPR